MKKRVTIKDVAKEANVSIATISYVINKKENLSKGTIDKVNSAIKKLNYIPDLSARSLVNKKSNLLGVVIPQTELGKQLMLNNPFYSEFISGVEYTARINGYHIILSGIEGDKMCLDVPFKRNLDGIIVLGLYSEEFYNELKKTRIPIVLVDSYCDDHYYHNIKINDRYGGYIATKYLIEKGHRKIAFVSGKILKEGVSEQRFIGYKDALEELNIPYCEENTFEGYVDFDYGLNIVEKIISKKGITAVFATADILAMGIMKGLKMANVKIPDDISVIGFDDISITKFIDPGLTTVKQNIYKKGEISVELIIDHINNKVKGKQEIILPIEIIERDSVKQLHRIL